MDNVKIFSNVFPIESLRKIREKIHTMTFRYISNTVNYANVVGDITNTQIQDYSAMVNSLYHESLKVDADNAYELLINEFKQHLSNEFSGYTVRRMNINIVQNSPNYSCDKFSIPHVDDEYLNSGDEFKTILFYVYDADGETIFFNEKPSSDYLDPYSDNNINNKKFKIAQEQKPVANTAVVFDSGQLHASRPPKIAKERIVINIVLRKLKLGKIDIREPFRTPIFVIEDFISDNERLSLENKILQNMAVSDGRKYSNYGGWQSELFGNPFAVDIQPFVYKVLMAADPCFEQLGIETTHVADSPTIGKCDGYWFNVNHKGDWNFPHKHPGCIFAAVLYIKADDKAGCLSIERPDIMGDYCRKFDYDTPYNTLRFNIRPKEKSLIIFPAWLRHSVESSNSDKMRLSIAFNIF